MFFGAHLALGLIIGEMTHNYPAALAGALLIDIDHLRPYIEHKIIFHPKKLRKTITDAHDPYGNQRNWLHSFFARLIISGVVVSIEYEFGIAFSLGYLSHLLLDMLDGSDFHPFYPFKYTIKGPIQYLSRKERILTAGFFAVFVALI